MANGLRACSTCAVMACRRARTPPSGALGEQMAITMQSTPTQEDTATNPSSSSKSKHCKWDFLWLGNVLLATVEDWPWGDVPTTDEEAAEVAETTEAPPPTGGLAVVDGAVEVVAAAAAAGSRLAYSSPSLP